MANKDVKEKPNSVEDADRMRELIRALAKEFPLDITWPHKLLDPRQQQYLDYKKKVICAGLGVNYEELETRIAEHVLGVDFAVNPDRTVVQELVQMPRDKAKTLLYAMLYGANVPALHVSPEPNKNGDLFDLSKAQRMVCENRMPPVPEIEFGAPLRSADINNIVKRVNELSEQFSMGCSMKPPSCPICEHEEKERLKKQTKENPFISHEAVEDMRKEMTSSRYIREYMGMWPPLEEEPKPFPGETEGAFFRRKLEWTREQREKRDQINYKAEARKEDDLPSVMAMGMKEVEKHKLMQAAAQKDFGSPYHKTSRELSVMEKSILGSGRGHSPGTEMFIEAQRKARPKKLVEQAVKQNEEALATKEMDKVTEGVNWKPGHCKICGHANGCHHPRVQTPESTEKLYEKACQHLFLTRVQGAIATELGANMADGMTCAIYACRECHKIIARIPMGSLPK